MKTTDNYLIGIVCSSFLLFASLENNPLSFTTAVLGAITIVLIVGFNKELKKD